VSSGWVDHGCAGVDRALEQFVDVVDEEVEARCGRWTVRAVATHDDAISTAELGV
jgi:hypothetical protein